MKRSLRAVNEHSERVFNEVRGRKATFTYSSLWFLVSSYLFQPSQFFTFAFLCFYHVRFLWFPWGLRRQQRDAVHSLQHSPLSPIRQNYHPSV